MLRCRLLARGPFLDLEHRCPARARRTRILHLARACRQGRRPGLPDARFDRPPDADTGDSSARRGQRRGGSCSRWTCGARAPIHGPSMNGQRQSRCPDFHPHGSASTSPSSRTSRSACGSRTGRPGDRCHVHAGANPRRPAAIVADAPSARVPATAGGFRASGPGRAHARAADPTADLALPICVATLSAARVLNLRCSSSGSATTLTEPRTSQFVPAASSISVSGSPSRACVRRHHLDVNSTALVLLSRGAEANDMRTYLIGVALGVVLVVAACNRGHGRWGAGEQRHG